MEQHCEYVQERSLLLSICLLFLESVKGAAWTYFSATCWFFGRDLYDYLKYPVGLVDTDWGGTPIESWSSPDALAKCNPNSGYNIMCDC